MNTPMSDIHALSGAYAVDALDDLERAQFERHLAECPDCRAEVDSLREAAGLLAATVPATPSDALRDRVLAGITTVRPLPPVVAAPERRRFRLVGLVAAAAVIAAVGTGLVVTEPWEDGSSQVPVANPLEEVRAAPDVETYTQEFPDGSVATLVRSASLNKAVLTTKDMAPPPDGKVYELWLDHEGIGMVPAGLMPVRPDAVVVLEGDPATAIGAGITIEPEGGSEEPTGDTVALIPFEDA